MKHTITLSQVSGNWVATFSNPKIKATGTDTFPTGNDGNDEFYSQGTVSVEVVKS